LWSDVTEADNGTLRVRAELEAAGSNIRLTFEAPMRDLEGDLEVEATTLVDQLLGMTWSRSG
jgi:hypothetical protein